MSGRVAAPVDPRLLLARSVTDEPLVRLTLPLPPIENHQYACVRGRKVLSAESRAYQAEICTQALIQTTAAAYGLAHPAGPLELRIRLYLRRDRDVSGCKVLQDALATAFGFNDRVISRLVVEKLRDPARPRCEVELRSLVVSADGREREV